MKISREDVLRVAQLAHLELAPEEVETYRGQLDEILSYVGKLQELDVSNVEPNPGCATIPLSSAM
jgi:aspartyl-tRNA(Asn)/glutamyl-tRNA(Gln) amidotransferase subunit C